MQSWLAKKLISYVMAHTRDGDIRPTLMMDADDVTFTFPGDNSWAGVYRGKPILDAEQIEDIVAYLATLR